jgi:thymidylate synthase (FAD)
VKILDHGYLEVVEHWGSDERIIEAARMSTGKGFLGWGARHDLTCPAVQPVSEGSAFGGECDCTPRPGDEKLLRYLWEHKHATPFEMAGLVVEVQAPIFVIREWQRHRTQAYNEMSARYAPLPDVNYVPSVERLMLNAGTSNKQTGAIKDAASLSEHRARVFQEDLRDRYTGAEMLYQDALRAGVPKEVARLILPVGRYSRMRASANLRNWLAFLTLRMDESAQWEIRQYANAISDVIAEKFPRTHQLFAESR